MSKPLTLEDFFSETDGSTEKVDVAAETMRLAAFEKGYKAGWDDAVRATTDDQAVLRAELSQGLQAVSFGYHEAQRNLLAGLRPLFDGVLDRLFPGIAAESLRAHLADILAGLSEAAAQQPVCLGVHPDNVTGLELLTDETPGPEIKVIAEPSFTPGQMHVRTSEAETMIDIDAALAAFRAALGGIPHTEQRKTTHVG